MNTPIDIQTPPEDLNKLFEIALPQLESLPPDQFVRRSVSRGRALGLTTTLLSSWATLVAVLEMQLSPLMVEQRKLELGRLKTRALVFYKADLASEENHANTLRNQRRALSRTVADHDRLLLKWAVPLFGDDPEHAQTLRDISAGHGARDDAEDVLRLADLYIANWDRVADLQQVVTRAYIDQAIADATRQLDVLTHGQSNPARKLADAAYSLWVQDYSQLMHLGRYLERGEPDVIARFPGVRELLTRSSRADDGEGEDIEDSEDSEDSEAGDAGDESVTAGSEPLGEDLGVA